MAGFSGLTLVWIGIAVAAAIVEVLLPHLGVAFVSGAAFIAAAVATRSPDVSLQVVTFAFALVVSFAVMRPWLVKRTGSRGVPSRTDQLIGKDAIVTHDIDPTVGAGRVNVGGEDWMARSRDAVTAGTRVRVVGADGIVLEVTRT